ncbi:MULTISPECIES: DUF3566 domain-containing protein [Frigoribacterium]|jgi:nitrogen fixation-related uncharacterized protein|uniref:DUF3566 domain-containing protein n=1 Tax=Frigoribacterium TaxID=96492 RepID=UPI0005BCB874|nr:MULTISPECIES: DUF3566 domain-containing protein [Frigoribacterium]KIU02889.1 membrane protein [Frigoribacterium sp. MEB024]KPG85597.1 hypothetical protein AEQ27_05330 [Frigoribacterium sp. RIT-PI-h]KQM29643.1 hypothetical protein ASL10_03105 [Frigoribacterium sp. Leaf8]KQN41149.1 hypothetical protein ASE87_09445 [Frigoribacterium sp. Leaf44]KQO48216.1 hypothetical protein ASF07_12855 [Frigoribacterium sp. Leaf254]
MSSVAERLQKKAKRPSGTKQVRLKLVYIDFWSVVKLAFLISVAIGIITVVATFLIWAILNQTGIFDDLDALLRDILGDSSFSIQDTFNVGQIMLFSIVVAILNVVVGTVLGAIVAVLYNLSVRITGGLLVGFTNN